MADAKDYKPYLCEYPFEGGTWSFEIMAHSHADAAARVKAMPWATVKGRLVATIPAGMGGGLFVRTICAVRNFFAAGRLAR